MISQDQSLQPREQDNAREHLIARRALALRSPIYSFEAILSWLSKREPLRVMILDIFERAVVVLVFGHFAFVMLTAPSGPTGMLSLVLLVSESLPVFLILTRRQSTAHSEKARDWFFSLTGTILPLLAVPIAGGALLSPGLCGAIMLVGLYVQISAKVILGRSFGLIPANRGIKLAGPYRIVRHPMYAGVFC